MVSELGPIVQFTKAKVTDRESLKSKPYLNVNVNVSIEFRPK